MDQDQEAGQEIDQLDGEFEDNDHEQMLAEETAWIAGEKARRAERDIRIAEKVKRLLAETARVTTQADGSYWVEIVDETTAWIAAKLTRTAIAVYYAQEFELEEGAHVRRWFFLVSEKDGAPYSPACLCVVPEGVEPLSSFTAPCHTVGFANARAHPDFASHIGNLKAVTGLPIAPNWAGTPLAA